MERKIELTLDVDGSATMGLFVADGKDWEMIAEQLYINLDGALAHGKKFLEAERNARLALIGGK